MLYCLSSSRHIVPVVAVLQWSVGEWLSLVEHLVRDQGVGGSNPLSPTNLFLQYPCGFRDHSGTPQLGLFSPPSEAGVVESVVGPRGTRKKGGSGRASGPPLMLLLLSFAPLLDQAALLLGPQFRLLLGVVFRELSERALDLLGGRMHVARGSPDVRVPRDLLDREGIRARLS
jgi:hypothetical protein